MIQFPYQTARFYPLIRVVLGIYPDDVNNAWLVDAGALFIDDTNRDNAFNVSQNGQVHLAEKPVVEEVDGAVVQRSGQPRHHEETCYPPVAFDLSRRYLAMVTGPEVTRSVRVFARGDLYLSSFLATVFGEFAGGLVVFDFKSLKYQVLNGFFDPFGNSHQACVSPDGQTILLADNNRNMFTILDNPLL